MVEQETKEELIKDIKLLISTDDDDNVDINPNFLEYFQIEELVSMKEQLIKRKNNIREDTFDYLDEIYEKTKEDSI
ncbi:hypothetical protein CRV01_13180 [Arcobacter sp. CECT 8983]|uniref:hypothetical protein n=1 Tax=Arcobacter sp. CECT 8983 TaxID=2044508 RepID=UPI00100B34D9|nr:hypothetical protein [Arcobacter sp. CECT 8983]RXJ88366.1 hypothetical protein CRV01_13180 [Arcobacter sp. CECT 8983]